MGRGPGRPKGSRDFRPRIIRLLEKFRLDVLILEEWRKQYAELSGKERLAFLTEMARLGVMASPKSLDGGDGLQIRLILHGVGEKSITPLAGEGDHVQRPMVDAAPCLALPAGTDSRARFPGRRPTQHSEGINPVSIPTEEVEPKVQGPIFTVPVYEEEDEPLPIDSLKEF